MYVVDTITRALQVTEGQPVNVRRYELRSRLSGHSVTELRDSLTVAQLADARAEKGSALVKVDLIDLAILHYTNV